MLYHTVLYILFQTEVSFVSLRDVERSLEVLTWFQNHDELNGLLDERFQMHSKDRQQEVGYLLL